MQPTTPNEYLRDHGLQSAIDSLSEESDTALPEARASAPAVDFKTSLSPLNRVRQWATQRGEMLELLRTERAGLTARLTEVDSLIAALDGGGRPVEREAGGDAPRRPVGRPRKHPVKAAPTATSASIPDVILGVLRAHPNAKSTILRDAVVAAGRKATSLDNELIRLRKTGRIKRTGARMHYRYSVAK
jgi:hypothetical protein